MASFNQAKKRSDQNDEDSLSDSIGDYTKQTPTDQLEDFCGFTDTEETDEGTTDKNACSTSSKSNETPNAHGNPNEQTSPAALRVTENTETSRGNRLPVTPTMTTATNAIMPLAPRQLEDFCGFTDTEETDEGTTDKNACSTSSKSNETPNGHGNPNEQTSPATLRVNENTETSTGNRLPVTPTVTTATNAIMPLAPRHRRIRQPFSRQNNQASITLIFHFYYI